MLIAAGMALLALLAGMWLYSPAPEPVYQGKPLSYWLAGLAAKGDYNGRSEEAAAVRAIGTNAIPTLLRMLHARDSSLKIKFLTWSSKYPTLRGHFTDATTINARAYYGFSALRTDGAGAVPQLIKMLNENVSDYSKALAAGSLACIGPPSRPAIPALLQAVRGSTNEGVHNSVFRALGRIHEYPNEVVPVLVQGLRDPFPLNHEMAAVALGNFEGKAKSAIPALVAALNDPALQASDPQLFNNVHIQVEGAIRRIDPETYKSLATNSTTGQQQ